MTMMEPQAKAAAAARRLTVCFPGLKVVALLSILAASLLPSSLCTSPTPAPSPAPTGPGAFVPLAWLPSVWNYTATEISFPSSSLGLRANGKAVGIFPPSSQAASAVGYGPCPVRDGYGNINPSVSMPVTSVFQLTSGGPQETSSIYTLNPLNLISNGTAVSWATEFYFQTDISGCTEEDVWEYKGVDSDTCASGFTFVIQSSKNTAMGGPDGDLGYANMQTGYPTIVNNSLAIEFDMIKSTRYKDPSGNYVGYISEGTAKHQYRSYANWSRSFNDGNIKRVAITYDNGTIKVYIADTPVAYPKLALSYTTALPAFLNLSNAFVGFTASTGLPPQSMKLKIFNWRFLYADPAASQPSAVPSLPLPTVPACPAPAPPPLPLTGFFAPAGNVVLNVCTGFNGTQANCTKNSVIPFPNFGYMDLTFYRGRAYFTYYYGVLVCEDPPAFTNCFTVKKDAVNSAPLDGKTKIRFMKGRAYLASPGGMLVCESGYNLSSCYRTLVGPPYLDSSHSYHYYTPYAMAFYKNMAYFGAAEHVVRCSDTLSFFDCVPVMKEIPAVSGSNYIYDVKFWNSRAYVVDHFGAAVRVCVDAINLANCTSYAFDYPRAIAFYGSSAYLATDPKNFYCPDAKNLTGCTELVTNLSSDPQNTLAALNAIVFA